MEIFIKTVIEKLFGKKLWKPRKLFMEKNWIVFIYNKLEKKY